jgi:hypothetical protein
MRRFGAVWVAIAVTVAACSGGEATTTTAAPPAALASSLVLGESGAPPGTEFAASLSWQQVTMGLDEAVAGGVVEELESLGLSDASVSVFVSPASSDTGRVDLAAGGLLAVSVALTFGDGASAESALEIIEAAAMAYAGVVDATPRPFDVGSVAEGAAGLVVDDASFPGGAAVVAWVEGAVLRISFAQGGDPTRDAQTLANAMTEVEP